MKTLIKNRFVSIQNVLVASLCVCMLFFVASGCEKSNSSLESADDNMVSIKIQCDFSGVVDPNIVSFALPGIVKAVCFKDPPNDEGFPTETFGCHSTWSIHLTMAKGMDRSKLAPIITLAPGATITPESGTVLDFTKSIEWTLKTLDGSSVKYYLVSVFVIDDTSDDNMVPINIQCSRTGAVDPNIVSFALPCIVKAVCFETLPYPDYGGPNAWSPHQWSMHLTIAKGTDRTKLAPIITLAPGAKITLVRDVVRGFQRNIEWELIAPDGSTVNYVAFVFIIGDPVYLTVEDDVGNQTVEIIYQDDPRYPF